MDKEVLFFLFSHTHTDAVILAATKKMVIAIPCYSFLIICFCFFWGGEVSFFIFVPHF